MTVGLGGPNVYTGKDLRIAHQHLKLEDKHFDIGMDHLKTALIKFGVTPELAKAMIEESEPLRNEVLNR
jgi:hemoglobin